MKITRWTAEISVDKNTIIRLFEDEGLDPRYFTVKSGAKFSNQKTYLNEIFQVAEGELIFNLSGTQFILRQGDKLEMPANTIYSYSNLKEFDGLVVSAQKI